MVIASHIIFSAYGFWLPNDPRGSWSDFVRSWELFQEGRANPIHENRSVATDQHDRDVRINAKKRLTFPPVVFSGVQAREIANGFAQATAESGYRIYACTILPDHIHAVVARHLHPAEQIISHLKSRATQQLQTANVHPFQHQLRASNQRISCWTSRGWKVFLDNEDEVRNAIAYVNENPIKAGLRAQTWKFIHSV